MRNRNPIIITISGEDALMPERVRDAIEDAGFTPSDTASERKSVIVS